MNLGRILPLSCSLFLLILGHPGHSDGTSPGLVADFHCFLLALADLGWIRSLALLSLRREFHTNFVRRCVHFLHLLMRLLWLFGFWIGGSSLIGWSFSCRRILSCSLSLPLRLLPFLIVLFNWQICWGFWTPFGKVVIFMLPHMPTSTKPSS